jgi:hypothetical protein
MSSTDDIPLLERPSFFHNQRLTANDLTAAQTYNRELRWLHNRSLHRWGIAFGFAVSGARGAQSVNVQPGYAIDCVGRDLILDEPRELPIPAVASDNNGNPVTYYLTISYAEDAQLAPINRTGECETSGAVRRPEMPIVRWQNPNDTNAENAYRQGFDVVLGAIGVLNCQLSEAVSGKERRLAVSPQQPYVAAGRTEERNTVWQLWPNDKAPMGVSTPVATSSAGFQTTPRYQAHVVGDRLFTFPPGNETLLVDGLAQIAQATASSFELRVTLPTGTTVGSSQTGIVSRDDAKAILKRIATTTRVPEDVILIFNPVLAVGKGLFTMAPFFQNLGALVKADFQEPLKKLAERYDVTRDALLEANGWNLGTVSLAIGQVIALPGQALQLNPKKIFKPAFMSSLQEKWHVVWMGVEG